MASDKAKELFEKKGVFTSLLRLALPTVAGQIILVIYNMADTFFVGLAGDTAMLTAVTVCMPAFMILSAIANLFGIGGGSVMARAMGKGDPQQRDSAASFSFWWCLIITLTYSSLAFLFRHPLVDLLGGVHRDVHSHAVEYLLVTVSLGGLFTAISVLFSHLLRSQGRSFVAGLGISLGGILNIILDPVIMFVLLPPGHESLGAAIATVISNGISMVFLSLAIFFPGGRGALRFPISRAVGKNGVASAVLVCGAPACAMTLLENASYAVLDKLMADYGIHAQAAIGVAKKINMLAHCLVRGIAQGSLPLIAYNFGAGKSSRLVRTFRIACFMAVGTALMCMTVDLVFAGPLVGLFIRTNQKATELSVRFLRILCVGAPFSALAYMAISLHQAMGRGRGATILAVLRKGLVDIPLMFILDAILPMYGLVHATPLTDIVCCTAAGIMLYRLFRPLLHGNTSVASSGGEAQTEYPHNDRL